MHDFLEELAFEADINIVYTNNKRVVLSSSIKDGKQYIRAHSIFKSCSSKVASAILGYYCQASPLQKDEQMINHFVERHFQDREYLIKPLQISIDHTEKKEQPQRKTAQKPVVDIKEANISNIVIRNFFGDECSITPNTSIHSSSQEVLELDITIDHGST